MEHKIAIMPFSTIRYMPKTHELRKKFKARHIRGLETLDFRHFSASGSFESGRVDSRLAITYQSAFEAKM